MLSAARKDGQQVTSEWQALRPAIDGVVVREVLHVPRDHGVITEIFRPEWDPSGLPVVHIYQSRLFPSAIGAWSCHTIWSNNHLPGRSLASLCWSVGQSPLGNVH